MQQIPVVNRKVIKEIEERNLLGKDLKHKLEEMEGKISFLGKKIDGRVDDISMMGSRVEMIE